MNIYDLIDAAWKSLKAGGVFFTLYGVCLPNRSAMARFLSSRGRGQFVRTVDGYIKLLSHAFSDVTPYVTHDLLRVPYTHLMMRAVKAGGS